MPVVNWTPDMDATLRQLHGRIGLRIIAERIGVARNTARNRLHDLRLPPAPRGGQKRPLPRDAEAALRRGWADQSLTVRELARRMGLPDNTVWNRARQLGLGPKVRDGITVRLLQMVAARPGCGSRMMVQTLGRELGADRNTVFSTLRRLLRQGAIRREEGVWHRGTARNRPSRYWLAEPPEKC